MDNEVDETYEAYMADVGADNLAKSREPKPDEGKLLKKLTLDDCLKIYEEEGLIKLVETVRDKTASIKDAEKREDIEELEKAMANLKFNMQTECQARIEALIEECARLAGGKYGAEDYIKRLKAKYTSKGDEG